MMRRNPDRTKPYVGLKRSRFKQRKFSKVSIGEGASEKALRDECDQLVREIIKLRDSVCVTCLQTQGLHVGHLFKRGKHRVRWNLLNVGGQCDFCNERHNLEPEHYIEAFLMKHGEAAYNKLRKESHEGSVLTYVDLLAIREGLQKELQTLKS